MRKKIPALITCAAVSVCLAGCSVPSDVEDAPIESGAQESSSFEVVKAEGNNEDNKEPSFEEANVLTFNLESRDDESSDHVETVFSVLNNGAEDVSDVSINFTGVDADGNIISEDGRSNDFGVPAGKSAFVKSYMSIDEGYSKSDISNVAIDSYTYRLGDAVRKVDLKNEKVENRKSDDSNLLDFKSADVISFEYEDKGKVDSDTYEVGIKVYNDGENPISNVSVYTAYFDEEGNYLGSDGRGSDATLEPGKFVEIDSFYSDSELSDKIASFGVFYYRYDLVEADENGWDNYQVNLKTGEATGWRYL